MSSKSAGLPYVFQLIERKEWTNLRRLLNGDRGQELCQQIDGSGLTCLALALGCEAPIDIIKAMVEIDPSLPGRCDKYGASAIHIGCLNGSSIDSLSYLLSQNRELARQVDADNRCALHHVVEFACCNISGKRYDICDGVGTRKKHDDFSLELLRKVFETAPEMIHALDDFGGTPIDLIQLVKIGIESTDSEEYKRHDRLYQLLKELSVTEYRAKKQLWEMESFSTTRKISTIKGYRRSRRERPTPVNTSENNATTMSSCTRTASLSANFDKSCKIP
jgi:hypothetical protein